MNIFEHIDKRTVIGFIVIFVLLATGFFYWLSGTGETDNLLTVLPASPLDATLGRELLSALATLKSTKLDTSVFEDPVFLSLKDFSVQISAQPVGRRNPFASFGAPTSTKTPVKTGTALSPKQTPSAPAPETGGFDIN